VKRLAVPVALVLILIIGGGLTTQLIARRQAGLVPVLRVTDNPEASVLDVVPWQAEQFFLVVGFILFNLVGMAVTIAAVVWLLDRAIRRGRAEAPAQPPARAQRTSAPSAE
jgi:hypothetical protein